MAGEKARNEGWFDLSTFKEPYRVEGKKIMGYELAEDFNWVLPDVIIYPTGGGTGLVGMGKAFAELEELGWLNETKRPRMVAVQAEGCAPVVKAFHAGESFCDFWLGAQTLASGLRVPKSFADHLILKNLRESQGTAVTISDDGILEAQRTLAATEGIFGAPETQPASSRPIIVFLFTEIIDCRQEGVGPRLDRFLCLVQGFSSYLG